MSQITAFSAREQYFNPIFEVYAQFQKTIKYIQGIVGTKSEEYLSKASTKIYPQAKRISKQVNKEDPLKT
jgi:hypothetical protein